MPSGADDRPRVVLLGVDLLFGSKLEHAVAQAGCRAERATGDAELADRLDGAALLAVDLADDAEQACALVERLRAAGALAGVHTLGYYQHVDDATRRRALAAGFDLVVPRSRLFREGADLIGSLLEDKPTRP